MAVFDAKGRQWTVEQPFAPWRRVAQPLGVLTSRYRSRKLRAAPPHRVREKRSVEDTVIEILILPFRAEQLVVIFAVGVVPAVLLTPVAILEAAAQAVAGGVLAVLRATGLVRRRVDVIGHTGHYLHSETVLLVENRRAGELVDMIEVERKGAPLAFRPDWLPAHVHVRGHRSMWQPTGEWV
jgi:hypothetical protein